MKSIRMHQKGGSIEDACHESVRALRAAVQALHALRRMDAEAHMTAACLVHSPPASLRFLPFTTREQPDSHMSTSVPRLSDKR